MSGTNKLLYSDDLCSAFMTAIVASFEGHVGANHYLGRTAIQKLVYFAKSLGAPIPCSFEIYTYGPYSDTVAFSVDSLLADDVLIDVSNKPTYSNYRLGENSGEILQKYSGQIAPYEKTIDAVVKSLGNFEPNQLELIATLHFIHHRLKLMMRNTPSREQVIDEFRRVKKDKFTRPEIDSFYDGLRGAKLI